MNLSKRQFLKMGVGAAAAVVLEPLVRTRPLWASPVILPHTYLESSVHSYWMKLSHNGGRESRQTRQTFGGALRNLGAILGKGRGFEFSLYFDRAVHQAFVRWDTTRQKPASLFGLVRMLYDDFIYPETGPAGGEVLFGTLLAVLRGREGTAAGDQAFRSYLSYRQAALAHKNAYRTTDDQKLRDEIRRIRSVALEQWRAQLQILTSLYASRQMRLDPAMTVELGALEGFEIYLNPGNADPPHLNIARHNQEVVVYWKGNGRLQKAPTVAGPWSDARKASPAGFPPGESKQFFRTVQDGASR